MELQQIVDTLKAMSLQMSENMERHAETDERITTLFAQSNELHEKQKVVEAHLSTPSPISAPPPSFPQPIPVSPPAYQPTPSEMVLPDLQKYSRDSASLAIFLRLVRNQIRVAPIRFSDPDHTVLYFSSFLTGAAREWFTQQHDSDNNLPAGYEVKLLATPPPT